MRTKLYYVSKGGMKRAFDILAVVVWLASAVVCIVGVVKIADNTGLWGDEVEVMVGIGMVVCSVVLFMQGFLLKAIAKVMEYIMLRKGEMYCKYKVEKMEAGPDGMNADWTDVEKAYAQMDLKES